MISLLKDIVSELRYITLFRPNLDDLKCVKKEGIKIKQGLVSQDICSQIVKDIDTLLEHKEVNIWQDKIGSDHRIYGMERYSEAVKELFDSLDISNLFKDYSGKDVKSYSVLGAKLSFKEENEGSGGGWHRDSTFTNQFKVIVYLSDAELENGPFQYIPKSHTLKSKLKNYTNYFGAPKTRYTEEEITSYGKIMEVTGNAGDGFFVDTKGIHRGKPIEGGVRYALTFYLWDKDMPNDVKKLL